VKAEYQCQQWIDREIALYSCCVIIIQIAVRVIDVQQLVTQIECIGCEEEYAEQGKDAKSGISSIDYCVSNVTAMVSNTLRIKHTWNRALYRYLCKLQ